MSGRAGGQRIVETAGLLTVADELERAGRPEPGERLRRALRELDEAHARESGERGEQRLVIQEELQGKIGERTTLLEQAAELQRRAEGLRPGIDALEQRLQNLPDEAAARARRGQDRLAALGRVLRADAHMVNDMLDAYAGYATAHRQWESQVRADPAVAEDLALVEYAKSSPEAIAALDDVLRGIIEQRLAEAEKVTSEVPEPARPTVAAPVYECVAPGGSGGAVAVLAVPCAPGALKEGLPHAAFLADVVAAMSQALLDLTDADAPVIRTTEGEDDPLRNVIIVGAVCNGDALDGDLLGVRVLELLSGSSTFGVEVLPIGDPELAAALAGVVQDRVAHR